MRTATLLLSSSLCLLLSATACGDEDDTGTDGTTDGGSSDGGSSDGGSTEDAIASVGIHDYPTGDAVVGATVTLGSDSYKTDSDGAVELVVPTWSAYEYTATAAGYLDMTTFGYNDGEGFSQGQLMVTRAAANAVYGAVGLAYDDTKGTTVVSVFDFTEGSGSFLAGATVELGASADVTLVADSGSSLGFSAGNTTLEGSSAWVLFMHSAAGSATPTITPPDGYSCTVFPGEESSVAFDLRADTLNLISFGCVAD